jgi:hypothetical protein
LTATTISPSVGERCAGITVLARLEQPDDGIPNIAIIIIVPRRAIQRSISAPLSQTHTRRLSLRTCVG